MNRILLTLLAGTQVMAADIPVYNSIFMAAGHSNGNQHANVLKLMEVLRTQTSYEKVEQLNLTLSSAVVNTETETVRYTFIDVVDRPNRVQCTFSFVFIVKPGIRNEAKLIDAKASENCQNDD